MASTLVYTSTAALSAQREAAREAAAARREAAYLARREAAAQEAAARFPAALEMVAEEGDCFGVKVYDESGKWRAHGWTAEMVARLVADPETDVEYWPIAREDLA